MILEIEDWHLGYDQIVKDTRGSDVGSVWVLCNADVDSLAAARILTYMFRADSIPYQLRPCWSYSTLTSLLQNEDSQDIRALVLLNLGASRNLTKLFDVDMLLGNAKVYVMDCRKPVHLANVHAGHNVVVFWDETQNRNELPSDGDNLSGNDDTTDEDDDSSSSDDDDDSDDDEDPDEGEAEFYDDDDKSKKKKETKIRSASDDEQDREYDGEDEDGAEDDDDDEPKKRTAGQDDDEKSATKRRKTGDDEGSATTAEEVATPEKKVTTTLTPKELHQQRRNRLRGYYSGGSFYGSPVAWVAYRLASQKRWHDNGDLLWLACIGLTDAYLHARIDMAGYTSLSVDLKTSCQRVFPNDMVDRVEKTIYAESLMGNEGGSQTQITLSDNGRILAETDYRFFLLRHSSLYDSMIYSNYVANRLQVWSTQGKQRLQELLAKMGFPLDECKQPFAFMNPHLKRKLNSKMKEYAGDYGLDKLEFTSFQRVTGYKSLVSASDMSYAVTGLLESESNESFHAALDALNAKAIPNTMNTEGYSASNLVNGGNLSSGGGIGSGLLKAMTLQKSIVATAMSLVERNAITRLRHFRYAFITCTSQESKDTFKANDGKKKDDDVEHEDHVFGQPLALTRLAHWVMDMHRENGKWMGNKSRPLVLCAEKPATKTYLVVGYEFPERQGMFLKNHFGQHFQMTCNSMQGTFRLNSFDSNVVEVDAKDVQRFIEQLHYMMDSM